MEGPGIISNIMEKSTTENHPGTINFPYRLAKAKQIHQENLAMASRLDSVKAYYDSKTLAAMTKQHRTTSGHNSPKKLKLTKRDRAIEESRAGTPGGPSVFDQHGRIVLGRNALHIHQTSAAVTGSFDPSSSSSPYDQSTSGPKRPRNVLLEYTKIQKGRVLDVAVIKEPFRDNYCIFGIDIDNGQRYELKLSSEEVSNILEGDILVTSVDNVEVWMTLLTKIELSPVEAFAKIPLPPAAAAAASSSTSRTHHPHPPHSQRTNPQNPYMSPSPYRQDGDHDTPAAESSSIDLEDESLVSALHCRKSSTPQVQVQLVSSTSIEPQTEPSPRSFSNYKQDSYDSIETTNSTTAGRGPGGGDGGEGYDSASILTAGTGGGGGGDGGDSDDQRYTLDEYYDSNIELTPLPLSESGASIKQANSMEGYGDVVIDPYYGQLDNTTLLQNRPSARGTSRDQQVTNRPVTASLTHPDTMTISTERDETKKMKMITKTKTEIISELANLTMSTIMMTVFKELQQVMKDKLTETMTETGTEIETEEMKNQRKKKEIINETRKKSMTTTTTTTTDSSTRKKSSVSTVVNKTNPYRSSKVSTGTGSGGGGGRSHSIRYTNEEVTSNLVTSTLATVPLQPIPPSEIQSSKQQSGIRKQSAALTINLTTNTNSSSRKQSSSIIPMKPQESMPSSRRPSKQSSTVGVTSTTLTLSKKISKIPITVTTTQTNDDDKNDKNYNNSMMNVEACHQLALSTALSVIELTQSNIQKLISLQEKK
jgi:hypothetical protein